MSGGAKGWGGGSLRDCVETAQGERDGGVARGMTDPFASLTEDARECLVRTPQPDWSQPMLATLTGKRFSDPGWLYERKYDGERAIAVAKGGKVKLYTRNRAAIGDTYPELVDALSAAAACDYVVDGEIVAFDGAATSFARLQGRMQIKKRAEALRSRIAVHYYVFDAIHLAGYSLERLPLRARKAALKRAFAWRDPLRYSTHRNRDGEKMYRDACRKGWEGVIAKRASAPYRHARSPDWLKFKCERGQELVIGGFTAPKGSRTGFGALLVGYYDDGALRYAGKVGTGFDHRLLADMRRQMDRMAQARPPFADPPRERDVTWVAPRLVGQFGFTEWTRDGRLRHPRFLGLRPDKGPRQVVRETGEGA